MLCVSLQGHNDELAALDTDTTSRPTSCDQLFSNAHIYDVQCVAVYSCRNRSWYRLLHIQLAQSHCGRHKRTLPLAETEFRHYTGS